MEQAVAGTEELAVEQRLDEMDLCRRVSRIQPVARPRRPPGFPSPIAAVSLSSLNSSLSLLL
jgi:hypothetical protein